MNTYTRKNGIKFEGKNFEIVKEYRWKCLYCQIYKMQMIVSYNWVNRWRRNRKRAKQSTWYSIYIEVMD